MAIYLGNQMIGINGIAQESGNAFVTLNTLNANTNTTYIAPSGTAYSQVNVDVPPTINYGVLRPDATLVKSIKQNYLLMEDEKITNTNYTSSFPAYSTSSITLRALGSSTVSPTAREEIQASIITNTKVKANTRFLIFMQIFPPYIQAFLVAIEADSLRQLLYCFFR